MQGGLLQYACVPIGLETIKCYTWRTSDLSATVFEIKPICQAEFLSKWVSLVRPVSLYNFDYPNYLESYHVLRSSAPNYDWAHWPSRIPVEIAFL